jgi:hypothetical protein
MALESNDVEQFIYCTFLEEKSCSSMILSLQRETKQKNIHVVRYQEVLEFRKYD